MKISNPLLAGACAAAFGSVGSTLAGFSLPITVLICLSLGVGFWFAFSPNKGIHYYDLQTENFEQYKGYLNRIKKQSPSLPRECQVQLEKIVDDCTQMFDYLQSRGVALVDSRVVTLKSIVTTDLTYCLNNYLSLPKMYLHVNKSGRNHSQILHEQLELIAQVVQKSSSEILHHETTNALGQTQYLKKKLSEYA